MTDTNDTQRITQRKPLRAFGANRAAELMLRDEAIRSMPRQEAFDRGYLTVKDLDDEELRYGRCRDENGYIPKSGKKTQLIPQDKYDAMIAEHELRFKQKLRQNLDDMLEIMVGIAKDDTVEPRDRFEAAKYLFERTAGKTPDKVDVTVKAAPWEDLLTQVTGIAPMSRAEHRQLQGAGIVDAEVVDIEEEHDYAGDDVQQTSLPQDGEDATEQDVVPVHKVRPGEQPELHTEPAQVPHEHTTSNAEGNARTFVGQEPEPGEPYLEYVDVPVGPDHRPIVDNDRPPTPESDDPLDHYGSRRTENKTYAQQARDAAELAARRKEAKAKIQTAKKHRKIARAMGADAITTEITGAEVGEDGKLTFDVD